MKDSQRREVTMLPSLALLAAAVLLMACLSSLHAGAAAPHSSSSSSSSSQQQPSKCDWTRGRWLRDERLPAYSGLSCSYIVSPLNCARHGRTGALAYQKLHWQPTGCNLTRFDPEGFSELVGNRTIAVIGDSLASNLKGSLFCLVSSGPAKLVPWHATWAGVRVNGFQHPKYGTRYTTLFSNYLVGMPKADEAELSKVDPRWGDWIDQVDIVLFQASRWYLQSTTTFRLKGHKQPRMSAAQAYARGMATVATFLAARKWAGIAVLLSHSPSHYNLKPNVAKKKGSFCEAPFPLTPKQGTWTANRDRAKDLIAVQRQVAAKYPIFRFADITSMTYLRPDSHLQNWFAQDGVTVPSQRDDCTHFCEAGVTDAWVEVVYNILLQEPKLQRHKKRPGH